MTVRERALVRNGSDPEQVRKAKQRETFTREDELNDLRSVLSLPAGRRVLWRLLGQAKAFESVFDSDTARMAYNAGRQDWGHFVIGEIGDAEPSAWILMQREANKIEENTIGAPDTVSED